MNNQEAPKSASEWLENSIRELKKKGNQDEGILITRGSLVGMLLILQQLVEREENRDG